MADIFGGDPNARAALLEILDAVKSQGGTEARNRAIARAHTAAKQYEATGDALLVWKAIEELTSPDLGEPQVNLPLAVMRYLHQAAHEIRSASSKPKIFPKGALKALGFAGRQGLSLADQSGKQKKMLADLSVYEVLKERHGAPKAEQMMADKLVITRGGMRDRLSDARKFVDSYFRAAGVVFPEGQKTGSPHFEMLSDEELLSLIRR